MAAILAFMDSPLVTWLQTFSSSQHLEFQEICDGAFLLDVFMQIADREEIDGVLRTANDLNAKLHNWGTLLHHVLNFYQEMLDQVVVMRLPDILSIVKDPLKDASLREIQKVLLLLLGCAVQSVQKESYINIIKSLPFDVQEALVTQIRQITDDPMTVVTLITPEEVSIQYKTWSAIAKSLTTERQSLDQRVLELHKECEYLRVEVEGRHGTLSPPDSLEAYHASRDLNACRNKLNQLTTELEERQKQLSEQKEELDQARSSLHTISHQNAILSKEAKMSRSYREEMEEYREEADKVQMYEKELKKYKERLREMEFFKARVEELRQDNDSLMELRGRLEEQVNASQKRSESVMDELIRTQLQMEDVILERDNLKNHLETLEEENSALSSSSQPSGGKGSLRRMLSYASSDFLTGSHLQLHLPPPPKGGTISDELRDSMDSRVTQLEAENDLLKENLDDTEKRLDDTQKHLHKLQAETQQEFAKKMSELEVQTKELRRKTSRELSKEFESKVLEIEQRSLKLKERVAQEFQLRVTQLEERNQQLQLQTEDSSRQLQIVQAAVGRGKEQSARTEKMSRDLVDEREHFKEQLSLLKESHSEKVRSLERQVDALRNKAEEMEKMALVSMNQSFCESNASLESPARISYVTDSPQKQRSKCSKENCKKRSARPRSSSTTSQDGRPVALQRHASVIGIPTEPCRMQRGREFHHHHFHHHHYDQEPARSAPTTPVKSLNTPPLQSFNRNDRLRSSSIQLKGPRTPTDHQPFVRNTRQTSTMPVRRRIVQSAPQTLERPPPKGMVLNSDVKKYPSNGMEHSGMHRTQYMTDTDSGCATSPDHSSASPDSTNGKGDQFFEVFTSETVQMQMRYSGSNTGKWKAFVDKIVELQNRNQHLLLENSEVRRTLKNNRGTTDRLDAMESKNLKLEVENRKLRRICESLQLSLVGKCQYDKRLYHFYSNV